ncbi:uncharacterized protein LOC114328379 [Diabrotica virgifera virgifera]|uniref:Uncharacterized protein n=1 Tax=Diabrotica virgifera virgifera TaxID=50390 RepID=A0ABM5IHN9_DIAVI|nr:uncharacterized protein LOC114328379 [Diabrotica virgifera virgifera]
MNTLLVASVFCAIFAIGLTVPVLTGPGPAFQVTDGECENVSRDELVRQEQVNKGGFPFVTKQADVEYLGDPSKVIYCVQALSSDDPSVESVAEITVGGVGHDFVNVHLTSKKGGPLHYDVEIYARAPNNNIK